MGYQWSFGFLWRYVWLFVTAWRSRWPIRSAHPARLVLGLMMGMARLSRSRL